MRPRKLLLLVALPLLAAGCKTRKIPKPEPGWFALGGSQHSLTLMDTAHIGTDGPARIVRIRIDSVGTGPGGNPVVVPSARRESLHRVYCASLTLDDLQLPPAGQNPAPGQLVATEQRIAFERHRYGPRVFPTVCSTLGLVGRLRADEKE